MVIYYDLYTYLLDSIRSRLVLKFGHSGYTMNRPNNLETIVKSSLYLL
jgi:hypothetical protein